MNLPVCSVAMTVNYNKDTQLNDIKQEKWYKRNVLLMPFL